MTTEDIYAKPHCRKGKRKVRRDERRKKRDEEENLRVGRCT